MKTFDQLVADAAQHINELMPWDIAQKLQQADPLLIDVREADEFNTLHIAGSHNIPRGVLEAASETGYDETHPQLSTARDKEVIIICRSGKRSCLAAHTLQQLGFKHVTSLKTGLRGWNDFEQPLVNHTKQVVDGDTAEQHLMSHTSS